MTEDLADRLDYIEKLERLRAAGHGDLVDALQDGENWTAGGRLCRSRVARRLAWTPARLVQALEECRAIVHS